MRLHQITQKVLALAVFLGTAVTVLTYEAADWHDPNIVYVKEEGKWVKHPGLYGPGAFKPGVMVDGQMHIGSYSAGTKFGEHTPPPINVDHDWARRHASITVLVASFRETRCPATLKSMFSKANFSERIYFGIIQQNADSDEDCLQGYCKLMGTPITKEQLMAGDGGDCKLFNHVRMVRMKETEAKGPVFARARQIETVYDQDDFCMQIDAHTDVQQGWDVNMIQQWLDTGNEFAVLSTYPTNVDHIGLNVNKHWEMPHLCKASFSGKGRIHNEQALAAANLDVPMLSPLWAAGLSFARCHAERNVPTDPVLKSTFTGEEYARGSRLWTAGYDFYSITRPILGTYYGGQKGGKGFFKHDQTEFEIANERMATLLKWPGSNQSTAALEELGIYGLGKKRTLEQYADFSGVDTIHQKSAGRCIVQYVPWDWAHPMIPELAENAYSHEKKKEQPPLARQVGANGKLNFARQQHEERAVARPARNVENVNDKKPADGIHGEIDDETAPTLPAEETSSAKWGIFELCLTVGVFYSGLTISKRWTESIRDRGPRKSHHLIA